MRRMGCLGYIIWCLSLSVIILIFQYSGIRLGFIPTVLAGLVTWFLGYQVSGYIAKRSEEKKSKESEKRK